MEVTLKRHVTVVTMSIHSFFHEVISITNTEEIDFLLILNWQF